MNGFRSIGADSCASRNARKAAWLGGAFVTLAALGLPASVTAAGSATARHSAGTPDNLEKGKQGETLPGEARVLATPYSKGVNVVGHVTMNAAYVMGWSGNCAYVPDMTSVNVVDVRNPAAPKVVGRLTEKGAVGAGETVNAAGGVLAASVYGVAGPKLGGPGQGGGDDAWLAVYDVRDCAHPKLMLEYKWPERIHTIRVSPNGKRIYGTVISPFTAQGGIQVLDISDPKNPRFLGKLPITRADGTSFEFAPHEVSISPDERRIYAGTIDSKGGDLNRERKVSPPNAQSTSTESGGIYILDNSEIALGRPDPKLHLVGTAQHAGWHSAIQARIGGVPHLVGAGELGSCPGAFPRITNIADERKPRVVGEFRLVMNTKAGCSDPAKFDAAGPMTMGLPGAAGAAPPTPSSHWNDVDSETNTRLGLFPFNSGGLRIADLRNPAEPTEIAYFKPGDGCGTHVRYMPQTGHIWFACSQSGFYVIELKPELRAALHLPVIGRRR